MSILKIDIDFKPPEEWLERWIDTRYVILEDMCYTVNRISRHETTKGQNFFIEIDKELPPTEINMLQFLLGDDHTRVKINQWRIERGIKHWNKIFDRKLFRKKAKMITCWYCGNKLPLIGVDKNDKV